MTRSAPKAIVLLSGGLDSATVLAMAKAVGYGCPALSVAYVQRDWSSTQSACPKATEKAWHP